MSLGLADATVSDQNVLVGLVKQWLGQHANWLLILDNVVQPADIDDLLPAQPLGHTIITSRDPNWSGLAAPLPIGLFTREESIAFLLDKDIVTPGAAPDASTSSLSPSGERLGEGGGEGAAAGRKSNLSVGPNAKAPHPSPLPVGEGEKQASELAEELGDLPLALAQAKAYIEQKQKSIEQYLKLFRDRRAELWKHEKPPTGYQKTVAETYSLAIEQVAAVMPDAEQLLNLCAFLAPDDIPRWLLEKHVGDEFQLDQQLDLLRRYALAEVLPYTISIHRLVQAICRDRLSDGDTTKWTETAAKLVNDAFPGDVTTNPAAWPTCADLLPHALAAVEHADHSGSSANVIAADATARLLNQMGVYQVTRAQFAAAEPLMRRALAIDEQAYGAKHPDVARDLNNLAQLLQTTNCLAEAEPLMRRALAIDEQSYGAEHPRVATDLNNLATLLQATNRLAEAEPLMRRALALDEQFYGADHPDVAIDLNNLAQLFKDTNRLEEAEPLMRRALAIWEQSHGAEHPQVAAGLNNLAALYWNTNRLAEAEPLMRRALEIDEQFYGAEHPHVAIRLNNLAQLLKATNRLAEAEPLMRRVVDILENLAGEPFPNYAGALNNLAQLLQATNRLAEAEPLMRRALAIDEQFYGAEHPKVAIRLNNLATLLQDTNRLAEAEPLMRRHVEIFIQFGKSTGHAHPHMDAAIRNYRALLAQMGHTEAEIAAKVQDLLKGN